MTVHCCQRYSQRRRETAAIRATWDENRTCCDSGGSNAGADDKADRLESLLFPDRRQQSRLLQLKVCQRDILSPSKDSNFLKSDTSRSHESLMINMINSNAEFLQGNCKTIKWGRVRSVTFELRGRYRQRCCRSSICRRQRRHR